MVHVVVKLLAIRVSARARVSSSSRVTHSLVWYVGIVGKKDMLAKIVSSGCVNSRVLLNLLQVILHLQDSRQKTAEGAAPPHSVVYNW